MNVQVFILFLNATLIPVVSSIIVLAIFKKQYSPVIKRLEKEQQSSEGSE